MVQIASTMNTSRIDVGFKQMVGPVGYRRSVQIDVVRACAILLVMGAHLRFEEPDGIMGSIAWAWHEWGGFAPERWAQAGFRETVFYNRESDAIRIFEEEKSAIEADH